MHVPLNVPSVVFFRTNINYRAAVEAVARQSLHASAVSGRESTSSVDSDGHPPAKRLRNSSSVTIGGNDENDTAFTNQTMDKLFSGIPSAHLKITSRKGSIVFFDYESAQGL